jgi:hypothetical protein
MLIQNSSVGIPEKGVQAAAIGYARLATQHGLRLPTEERVVHGIFPPREVPRCRKVIRVKQEAPNLSE